MAINDEGRLGVLEEYLDRFKYAVKLSKKKASWYESNSRKEIMSWTRASCGAEYKDWYCYVGGTNDPTVHFAFIQESKANWFALRWSEYIGNE